MIKNRESILYLTAIFFFILLSIFLPVADIALGYFTISKFSVFYISSIFLAFFCLVKGNIRNLGKSTFFNILLTFLVMIFNVYEAFPLIFLLSILFEEIDNKSTHIYRNMIMTFVMFLSVLFYKGESLKNSIYILVLSSFVLYFFCFSKNRINKKPTDKSVITWFSQGVLYFTIISLLIDIYSIIFTIPIIITLLTLIIIFSLFELFTPKENLTGKILFSLIIILLLIFSSTVGASLIQTIFVFWILYYFSLSNVQYGNIYGNKLIFVSFLFILGAPFSPLFFLNNTFMGEVLTGSSIKLLISTLISIFYLISSGILIKMLIYNDKENPKAATMILVPALTYSSLVSFLFISNGFEINYSNYFFRSVLGESRPVSLVNSGFVMILQIMLIIVVLALNELRKKLKISNQNLSIINFKLYEKIIALMSLEKYFSRSLDFISKTIKLISEAYSGLLIGKIDLLGERFILLSKIGFDKISSQRIDKEMLSLIVMIIFTIIYIYYGVNY